MSKLVITFFGLGLMPIAPGTWGSLGAVAVWLGMRWACTSAGVVRTVLDAVLVVLAVLIGAGTVAYGPWAIQTYGRGDPGPCVSDEVAGQWIALAGMPAAGGPQAMAVAGAQFVLFRLFDILKPPPARQLERLPAGWGILMDDVAAGLMANIVGQILFRYFWRSGG